MLQNMRMECRNTFQGTKIPMGRFQVCDALSIFFELEKPFVKHLEGFILLPRESGKLQNFFRTIDHNSSSRTQNNSPTGSAKVNASMVEGMFAVATMSC